MSVIKRFGRRTSVMLTAALALVLTMVQADAVELVMVREPGCIWCERWDAEIGPIYPKTAESTCAPLRMVDIRAIPDNIAPTRRVQYTPTFLLVDQGRELARIEGYPGEDFFWALLARLLRDNTTFTQGAPACALS